MKTIIYYFTGTGNTLSIVQDLAANLDGQIDLVPIAREFKKPVAPVADRVGFVFPLYFMGTPEIVAEFIKKINLKQAKYLFAIVNQGFNGPNMGSALSMVRTILRERGYVLNYSCSLAMPDNYIITLKVPSNRKCAKMLARTKQSLVKIAADIKAGKSKLTTDYIRWLAMALHKSWIQGLHKKDSGFWSDEKCNSCAICVKVCPVNNILMKDQKPQWQHNCQQCLACIHYCPEQSIQYGQSTAAKVRYHHPGINWQQVAAQK